MSHPFHVHGFNAFTLHREAIYDPDVFRDDSTPCTDTTVEHRVPLQFDAQDASCARVGASFFNSWGADLIPPINRRKPDVYDPTTMELNLVDPPRTDMPLLPSHGLVVWQFYTSNPGAWFFHCHLEFHAGLGMALAFVVGGDDDASWPSPNKAAYELDQLEGRCTDIEFEGKYQFE
mmetsp:Transcript_21429/g.85238  ORF Transcript_21429/g.85238 Transcript_21429/m.85238 type:complete len:176 (-) Transcript_21429:209-736(-)